MNSAAMAAKPRQISAIPHAGEVAALLLVGQPQAEEEQADQAIAGEQDEIIH